MKNHSLFPIALACVATIVACVRAPVPSAAEPTLTPTAETPIATAPPRPTTLDEIRLWHGLSRMQQIALDDLIDKFHAAHPDIQVRAIQKNPYGDPFWIALPTWADDALPDLALAYSTDIAHSVRAGRVLPLDDLLKDPHLGLSPDDLKDIFPAFLDHYAESGDKVYSLAFAQNMQVMYYNADLLRAAGFSRPPQTWDEFMQACAAISKPPDVYCYAMKPNASDWATWVWSRGGEMLSADAKRITFDQKPGLDTLTFVSDLFSNKYALLATRPFQDHVDFATTRVAFTFDTTVALPVYDKAINGASKPFAWGIAPSPRATRNAVVNLYGPSLAILRTTPERERAAFVFVKWLMAKEQNAAWTRATGMFPARASARAALADFITANPLYANALDWPSYGRTEPNVAEWAQIRGFIAEALTAVAGGKAKPEDALQDAAKKANGVLANQ